MPTVGRGTVVLERQVPGFLKPAVGSCWGSVRPGAWAQMGLAGSTHQGRRGGTTQDCVGAGLPPPSPRSPRSHRRVGWGRGGAQKSGKFPLPSPNVQGPSNPRPGQKTNPNPPLVAAFRAPYRNALSEADAPPTGCQCENNANPVLTVTSRQALALVLKQQACRGSVLTRG